MTAQSDLPEGWTGRTLRDVSVKIQDGTHFSPLLGGSEYKYITSKNIGLGILKLDSVELISETEHRKIYRRCDVRAGDILLTKDGANTGNAALSTFREEVSLLSSVAFIRTDRRSALGAYLLQYILSAPGHRQIADAVSGNAITRLTLAKINNLVVPLPPVEEQRKIAVALASSDDQIATMEHLIAKKLAIKQGMMQQFLGGKTRLPGFTAEWCTFRLGELGTFLKGRGIKRDDVRRTGVPCIRYGEIYTIFADYTSSTASFVDHVVAKQALPIRAGDLLFAGSGETHAEIGKCVAFTGTGPAVAGGDIVVLRGTTFNPSYLASLTNTPAIAAQKARRGQGDAIVHLSSRALSDIVVNLPPQDEQDAIAAMLIDVKDQVDVLHSRLAKAKAIKQGMMQELLTGHTRLPVKKGTA